MKSWLRDDRVYQAIMNGALWIVVIAALFTTKWPQLSWLTGSITAVLVVIVVAVYWIVVVTNDNDKPESTSQRQSTELAKAEEPQEGENVVRERRSPPRQHEEELAYWNARIHEVRSKNLEVRSKSLEVLRQKRWAKIIDTHAERSIWTSYFEERNPRVFLVSVASRRGSGRGEVTSPRAYHSCSCQHWRR